MKLRQGLLIAALLVTSPAAYAGFEEGWTAYLEGDHATALREWRALAEQGDGTAQYNIAVMYDTGQGVRQDDVEAYAWYSLAVSKLPQGPDQDRAERRRLVVVQFMTVDQINQAEALVRDRAGTTEGEGTAAAAGPPESAGDVAPARAAAAVLATPVLPTPDVPKRKPPDAAPAPGETAKDGALRRPPGLGSAGKRYTGRMAAPAPEICPRARRDRPGGAERPPRWTGHLPSHPGRGVSGPVGGGANLRQPEREREILRHRDAIGRPSPVAPT